MYVYDESISGQKLSDIINLKHENTKYLPGCKLPENVVCSAVVFMWSLWCNSSFTFELYDQIYDIYCDVISYNRNMYVSCVYCDNPGWLLSWPLHLRPSHSPHDVHWEQVWEDAEDWCSLLGRDLMAAYDTIWLSGLLLKLSKCLPFWCICTIEITENVSLIKMNSWNVGMLSHIYHV